MGSNQSELRIGYVTLNGRIPSRSANSVGVMKMCGQYSSLGLDTCLFIPDKLGDDVGLLSSEIDEFDYYSVAKRFKIVRVLNPFSLMYRFSFVYTLLLFIYIKLFHKIDFFITRSIDLAFWSTIFKFPVVFETHNFEKTSSNKIFPSLIRRFHNHNIPALMVVTTGAGKESFNSVGIPEDRILVASNAADVELFDIDLDVKHLKQEIGVPLNIPCVVFCGSFGRGKGVDLVLECASLLKNVFFLFVGGSPADINKYLSIVDEKGMCNVKFVGHVAQSMVPKYLSAADILVLPNTSDPAYHSKDYTSPIKMFEYLATGTPIVASDFPVFKEVLEDGENSVLVKPDSATSLAEGIERLLTDQNLYDKIRSNAKKNAKRYSWRNRALTISSWAMDKFGFCS